MTEPGDDMILGDVTYREPRVLRRPDRDRRVAVVAYEVPGPGELPVFLDRKPADAIERHALRDTAVELGGVLLGRECVDDQTGLPFVWVTESLEARHYENTQASFTYTHDSWGEITRERDAKHPDLDIVGWYHTHPDFGIFLSGHDQFIHRHFFAQPLQVAYVVDPIRQTRGFFQWRDGALVQLGGFYLAAARADRSALARLANDLENLPNADPGVGGGAMSPRLEAELIAMLSRPVQSVSAPDRALGAAAFGLLGLALGALIVLLAFGLLGLLRQAQAQTEAIAALQRSVSAGDDARRLAEDALAGEVGASPAPPSVRLASQYGRLARERDAIALKYENQLAAADAVAARLKAAEADLKAARAAADEATTLAKSNEADAREARALRTRVADLAEKADAREKTVAEQDRALDALKIDGGAVALLRRYAVAWYAAAAGWSVAAMVGLGLVAVAFRGPPATVAAESPHPIG